MDGGWMDKWMVDGWMDGWMGGWMDGWMDGLKFLVIWFMDVWIAPDWLIHGLHQIEGLIDRNQGLRAISNTQVHQVKLHDRVTEVLLMSMSTRVVAIHTCPCLCTTLEH